ncbi:hypothetical protein FE257_007336 [Aspergillus nanangensis]|uniref:DUF202 domain-containing protein n=1 Tax=Aspergillus nanangensis TaxID=2582783 RepID=A0AAD4CMT8_ASPNN|nr:hypothetical protein FE257_007336 [Aspergillus nanangensis]
MHPRPDEDGGPDIVTVSASGARSPSSSPDHPHPQPHREDSRERDALELHEIETQEDAWSSGSISSGEYRVTTRRTVSRSSQRTVRSQEPRKGVWGRLQRLWTRNVVLTVPQNKNRDHFALERTFLAYIRTSVMVAMQGVLVAQLFRLQHQPSLTGGLSYYEVGIPLSVTFHSIAILIAVLGAVRFWKQQSAIALGTVYAGGWELNCIGLLIGSAILVLFILSLIITVEIESHM